MRGQPILPIASRGPAANANPHNEKAGNAMIYELRIYHASPGRMSDLLARFRDITLDIWKKHGIEQVGFWTTYIGESNNDLYYLLKWDSLAEREKRWNAFQSDQEWLTKRAETEKNGPLTTSFSSYIMTPTEFSAMK